MEFAAGRDFKYEEALTTLCLKPFIVLDIDGYMDHQTLLAIGYLSELIVVLRTLLALTRNIEVDDSFYPRSANRG